MKKKRVYPNKNQQLDTNYFSRWLLNVIGGVIQVVNYLTKINHQKLYKIHFTFTEFIESLLFL